MPPVPDRGPKVTTTDEVGGEYLAPDRLESGFHLLGRYEQPGGAVQLFYSDGLFSLSLFEQPGEVEWAALPEGGRRDTVAEQRAQWYATHAGTVVVWSRDGLVLTGVSDAPPDTVRAAVATVKAPEGSVIDDVVDFVLEPFDWEWLATNVRVATCRQAYAVRRRCRRMRRRSRSEQPPHTP